jgi:hypothetical protein
MLDEADIKASRLAAPKEAVGRAVVKAVKKDRIQLAVMPGQGRLLRAVMDYLPGPRPALNRAARATTTRRKSSNTAVQRRRRGNLMTASIFTLTSTTSHSQNPCPPATTQAQADPRESAPTNHCSQAEHARPLTNSLPRPEKASEPELDDMSTTGRATSPPDQSLILGDLEPSA